MTYADQGVGEGRERGNGEQLSNVSKERDRSCGPCRMCRCVSHSANRPTGTLTKKMLRQPKACTRRPPRTGPRATPSAPALAHADIAVDRRSGSIDVWFSAAKEFGRSSAAPIPCTTREICSTSMLGAIPHKAEASVNTTRPHMKVPLAPNRSPNAPAPTASWQKPARSRRPAIAVLKGRS